MTEEYSTKVNARNISQPNAYTCQSACIAMVTGEDVMRTRVELEALGAPGDPMVMGKILGNRLGKRYSFDDNASLNEIRSWLKAGDFLITHGWFTNSGHVVALDGVRLDPKTLSYAISVKDPWSEFDFPTWSYNKGSKFFDGYYSSHGLYAAIVAGASCSHAASIYARGELDSSRPGAWVHRVVRG